MEPRDVFPPEQKWIAVKRLLNTVAAVTVAVAALATVVFAGAAAPGTALTSGILYGLFFGLHVVFLFCICTTQVAYFEQVGHYFTSSKGVVKVALAFLEAIVLAVAAVRLSGAVLGLSDYADSDFVDFDTTATTTAVTGIFVGVCSGLVSLYLDRLYIPYFTVPTVPRAPDSPPERPPRLDARRQDRQAGRDDDGDERRPLRPRVGLRPVVPAVRPRLRQRPAGVAAAPVAAPDAAPLRRRDRALHLRVALRVHPPSLPPLARVLIVNPTEQLILSPRYSSTVSGARRKRCFTTSTTATTTDTTNSETKTTAITVIVT